MCIYKEIITKWRNGIISNITQTTTTKKNQIKKEKKRRDILWSELSVKTKLE